MEMFDETYSSYNLGSPGGSIGYWIITTITGYSLESKYMMADHVLYFKKDDIRLISNYPNRVFPCDRKIIDTLKFMPQMERIETDLPVVDGVKFKIRCPVCSKFCIANLVHLDNNPKVNFINTVKCNDHYMWVSPKEKERQRLLKEKEKYGDITIKSAYVPPVVPIASSISAPSAPSTPSASAPSAPSASASAPSASSSVPKITGDDKILFVIKPGEITVDNFKPGHPVFDHLAKMYPYEEYKPTNGLININSYFGLLKMFANANDSYSAPLLITGSSGYILQTKICSQPDSKYTAIQIFMHSVYIDKTVYVVRTVPMNLTSFQFPPECADGKYPFEIKCPTCGKYVNFHMRKYSWLTPDEQKQIARPKTL
jgi:hypothetical protein